MHQRIVLLLVLAGLMVSSGSALAWNSSYDEASMIATLQGRAGLVGVEDFESSTLAPGSVVTVDDPLSPGVANGPFPNGTFAASGLTIQSNSLTGWPTPLSPGGNLAATSIGYNGATSDQVRTHTIDHTLDLIFAEPGTYGVSFTPIVYDNALAPQGGQIQFSVYDKSGTWLGAVTATFGTANGVFAISGCDPGPPTCQDIGRINMYLNFPGERYVGVDNVKVYLERIFRSGFE
jgi:hypothetical protein